MGDVIPKEAREMWKEVMGSRNMPKSRGEVLKELIIKFAKEDEEERLRAAKK